MDAMALTWPQVTAWPNDLHEHATYLSKYLRDALRCIEDAKEHPIPPALVKTIIAATCAILTKIENTPDYKTVMQTLTMMRDDLKTTTNAIKTTVESAQTTATTAQRAILASQQAILISQDTNAITKDTNTITKEAAQAGRAAAVILQETNRSNPPLLQEAHMLQYRNSNQIVYGS